MIPSVTIPLAAFCAAGLPSGVTSPALSPDVGPSPPSRLVDIGGYRLHLRAMGQGGPTVVLVYGAGAFSIDWGLVVPEIAKFTRVVAYDRAGDAWSDPGPQPQTMAQDCYELHTLLRRARIRPPYVLVGHSLGGPLVRWYARQYPGEVVAMILEDATDDDTVLGINGKDVRMRTTSKGRPLPPVRTGMPKDAPAPDPASIQRARDMIVQFHLDRIESPFDRLSDADQKARVWAASRPEHYMADDPYLGEELQTLYEERHRGPAPLGDMPLLVMIPDYPPDDPGAPKTEERKRFFAEKRQQKIDQAHLSRNGRVVFVPDSGHEIHLFTPTALVGAVREVVDSVRRHTAPPGVDPGRAAFQPAP